MRSRRHKLQVSTFPFLAVLLCAMGALLLVLLVMDRRAHYAARERAEQAARRAAEETAREADERRAALELARQAALSAQQQQHDSEHARLESQTTEAKGETRSVEDQIAQAAGRLRAEQDEEAALKQKTEAAHAQATAEEQALIQVRGEEAKKADQSEASRKALAEMTADLAQLERTLADLKAAREKGQKTYSVVPYNGKRGENRRPLYIECASDEVIFHPDRTAVDEAHLGSELQADVEHRLARQKEQLPPAQAAAFSPYLMLLVRPDGVVTYYRLREALRALKIDFGYEFIDQDWALDFSGDDSNGPAKPWMTLAKPPAAPPSASPVGAPLHGVTVGRGPMDDAPSVQPGSPNSDKIGTGDADLGSVISGPLGVHGPGVPPPLVSGLPPSPRSEPGNSGSIGAPADPGLPPQIGASPVVSGSPGVHGPGAPPLLASGSPPSPPGSAGEPGNSGSNGVRLGPGLPSQTAAAPGALVLSGPPDAHGPGVPPPTASRSPPAPPGSPGQPGNGDTSAAPTGPGSSQAEASPAVAGPSGTHGPGVPPPIASGPPPAPPGPPGQPGTSGSIGASAGPGTAQAAGSPPASAGAAPPPPTPPWAPTEGPSASPSAKDAAKATPGSKPTGAAESAEDDPFLRTPPPPLPLTSRPAPSLRPARLNGDRDWIIYVECKQEGVVIYPTRLLVPASALSRPVSGNPLPQTVQQLIDRKQATVKHGDLPYRPEVRFLVHPDAVLTYHLAYPTLDALAAPKTAQTLGPDDDVAAIVTGH